MRKGFIIIISFFVSISGFGQYPLNLPYTQDFNTLANAGTSNVLPTGWVFEETGANANTTYAAGNGSSNTGDTYSFGTIGDNERAFGGLLSGSLTPYIGFWVNNNSGSTIFSLLVSYTGEQWRLGATGRADQLDFQYSVNATSVGDGAATWINANALDFIAPNSTGTVGMLDGNLAANRVAISSTIVGLNIPNGASFYIRWSDFNASGADDGLGIDDFSLTIVPPIPSSTNYFQSVASGDWSNVNIWEESPTGGAPWNTPVAPPDFNANTIVIKSTHVVTITNSVTVNQVIVENGAILENNISGGNTFTLSDEPGDELDILYGGIYRVTTSMTYPNIVINPGATVRTRYGGTIQIGNGGSVGGNNTAYASTMNSFIWEDSSIFNWNTSIIPGIQVTFFPDVNATTIPILRFTAGPGVGIGGGGNTIVNGRLETSVPLIFENGGLKVFRNGIRNSGDISTEVTSGLLIINGINAELGGLGEIDVSASGGLQIGSITSTGTVVTVTDNKTITGFLSLINTGTGAYVELGANNLTVTGGILGDGQNSYIRTNGTGRLVLLNVTSARKFPIGETSYNPVTISNGGGADYYVRVNNGIVPGIAFPTYGINRTWNIQASTTQPTVTVAYQFASADANVNIVPPEDMELLMNDGSVWSIIAGNGAITPTGTDPWVVTTAAPIAINSATSTPYCIGKKGGWILPLDCIIACYAQKVNNNSFITFDINTCAEVINFEVQRSSDGRNFEPIAVLQPDLNVTKFSYYDMNPFSGTNFYRIRVNRYSGDIKYSNTVAIIYGDKGMLLTSIAPNPVHHTAVVTLSSAKNDNVHFAIYNMAGVIVKQWSSAVQEGNNAVSIHTDKLAGGVYHLVAVSATGRSVLRFVKQ